MFEARNLRNVRTLNSRIHLDSLNAPIIKFKCFSDAETAHETIRIASGNS